MSQLVQISKVPPLRQSLVDKLACPRSYVALVMQGLASPASLASDRGTEIHKVAAAYTLHCVKNKVPADWLFFDKLCEAVGPDAALILEGVRDNYKVAFDQVVDAEWTFWLDENFSECSPDRAAYTGTMDLALLDGAEGEVQDWKSHIRPFDAPTPQSDLYSLVWLLANPELETVTFRFRFVRYRNCERTAEYTRADLPRLMSALEHWRAKQLAIHEHPERAEAIPSKQCLYCPLLNQGCPIDPAVNPYAGRDPLQWTKRLVYLTRAMKQAKEILKEALEATGEPIEYVDGTGERYFFGKKATESEVFPLFEMDANRKVVIRDDQGQPRMPIVDALADWFGVAPDDAPLFKGINISSTGLKAPLKAGKRAIIHQAVMDNTRKVTKVKLALHQPDDDPEDEARERDGE